MTDPIQLRKMIGEDPSGNDVVIAVDSDGNMKSVSGETDDVSGIPIGLDFVHHKMHEGDFFFIEGHVTLANAAVLRVKLVTPDTDKWAHFQWDIGSSGMLETKLYEGASGGMAGGSGVTPINSNRNSAKVSGLVITSGVAVATTPGTLISDKKWGATGRFSSAGGGDGRTDELILKQNTTYYRVFTSGAADNIVTFRASWYEHTSVT